MAKLCISSMWLLLSGPILVSVFPRAVSCSCYVLLSTINWAICKAIDLLELLKIEEEMLSAQSRKTVKVIAFFTSQIPLYTAKRQYSRPAQPITFATFAQDVLQGSAQVSRFTNRRTILLVYHR
ncbi:unnamed protein product [Brassica oleracea]